MISRKKCTTTMKKKNVLSFSYRYVVIHTEAKNKKNCWAEKEKEKKRKSKNPFDNVFIETLGGLKARKSDLIDVMKNQKFITAIDAKRLKIIDDAGLVKNKYQKERKKYFLSMFLKQ